METVYVDEGDPLEYVKTRQVFPVASYRVLNDKRQLSFGLRFFVFGV